MVDIIQTNGEWTMMVGRPTYLYPAECNEEMLGVRRNIVSSLYFTFIMFLDTLNRSTMLQNY